MSKVKCNTCEGSGTFPNPLWDERNMHNALIGCPDRLGDKYVYYCPMCLEEVVEDENELCQWCAETNN